MKKKQEDFTIREYHKADYDQICRQMEDFQNYLSKLDSMKIVILDKDYGRKYTDATLKMLPRNNGKFLVITKTDETDKVIGFGIGIIPKSRGAFFELGHKPRKEGIVSELFVLEKYRGEGLGRRLIVELEKYFLEQGCNYCRLSVMTDNKGAHQAYLKMGFEDRTVEMLRRIS